MIVQSDRKAASSSWKSKTEDSDSEDSNPPNHILQKTVSPYFHDQQRGIKSKVAGAPHAPIECSPADSANDKVQKVIVNTGFDQKSNVKSTETGENDPTLLEKMRVNMLETSLAKTRAKRNAAVKALHERENREGTLESREVALTEELADQAQVLEEIREAKREAERRRKIINSTLHQLRIEKYEVQAELANFRSRGTIVEEEENVANLRTGVVETEKELRAAKIELTMMQKFPDPEMRLYLDILRNVHQGSRDTSTAESTSTQVNKADGRGPRTTSRMHGEEEAVKVSSDSSESTSDSDSQVEKLSRGKHVPTGNRVQKTKRQMLTSDDEYSAVQQAKKQRCGSKTPDLSGSGNSSSEIPLSRKLQQKQTSMAVIIS